MSTGKRARQPAKSRRSNNEDDDNDNDHKHTVVTHNDDDDDYGDVQEEELEISSDEDDDNGQGEVEEEEGEGAEVDEQYTELQVEFNVDFPKEIDYKGVKNFVKHYTSSPNFHDSEFAELIVAQNRVGHVIRIDGNDEIFGFVTCLNMRQHADKRCLQQIREFVLDKASADPNASKLESILENEQVGLIVSERMLNVPYELVLPIYRALFANMHAVNDQQKASRAEPSFKFSSYLIITSYLQKIGKEKRQNKKNKQRENESVEYGKVEDEYFRKFAALEFEFPISSQDESRRWTLTGTMAAHGLAMWLPQHNIDGAIVAMEQAWED